MHWMIAIILKMIKQLRLFHEFSMIFTYMHAYVLVIEPMCSSCTIGCRFPGERFEVFGEFYI